MRRTKLPRFAAPLLLAAVCALIYAGTLASPFLSYDDDRNVTANPLLLARDVAGFWRAPFYGLYIPLTYTAWTGLASLGGGSAAVFHGANLLLHWLAAVLVYSIGLRLVRDRAAALLGALLFLCHPLQVEAVAWVSGMRDLGSAVCALTAVLIHLGPDATRDRPGRLAAELAFFVAALLFKPAVASLPLALAALDWLTERRSARKALTWAVPGLVIAGAAALLTARIQSEVSTQVAPALGWSGRLAVAADALGFYVGKLCWPLGLSPDYGRSPASAVAGGAWLPGAAVVAAAAAAAWAARRPLGAGGRAGLAVAALLLLPTLGLVTFAFQRESTVADRYVYLPLAGLSWAAAALLAHWCRARRARRWVVLVSSLAAVAALSVLSRRATVTWSSDAALFTRMVATNPRSFSGHVGLGANAMRAGAYAEALDHYERALAAQPLDVTALSSAGLALDRLGRYGEVLTRIRPLLPSPALTARSPASADMIALMLAAVGYAELQTGDGPGGFTTLCRATAVDPANAEIKTMVEQAKALVGRPGC